MILQAERARISNDLMKIRGEIADVIQNLEIGRMSAAYCRAKFKTVMKEMELAEHKLINLQALEANPKR